MSRGLFNSKGKLKKIFTFYDIMYNIHYHLGRSVCYVDYRCNKG